MTYPTATTEQLLRAARDNREFREAFRREILTEELIKLPETFAAYASMTDRRLESIESDISELKRDTGILKGVGLESRLADKGLAQIASTFSMRRMRIVRLAEHNRASERFNEAIWAALDSGQIDNAEYQRLLDTDLIVRGTLTGEAVAYCAAEASYTAEPDDIDKASRSATILRKVFSNAAVYAAVYYMEGTEGNKVESRRKGVELLQGQLP